MIRAAFFDIDGTLLDFGEKGGMPESTRASLAALRRKGVMLGVASGRAPFMLDQLKRLFRFDGYVTLNGQYVTDGDGRVLHTLAHDPEDIRALLPLAKEQGLACMMIEGMESFPLADDPFNRMMYGWLGWDLPPLYDPARLDEHPVLQFSAWHGLPGAQWPDARPLQESIAALQSLQGVEVTSAGGGVLDCIPRHGGKEVGIAAACKQWGISREEIVVFGDGINDIRMIRWAGTGVAMGNAPQQVKDAADLVTTPVGEDGVKHAMLRLGLLEESDF